MLTSLPVTVLGGGIAGLAVARALALRGARVTVLERAPALAEVGAGIQIAPNGARVLRALGLGAALEAAGMRSEGVELLDGETGGRVLAMPFPPTGGPGYFYLHRADLVALLADGAEEAGVEILTGQEVGGVSLAHGKAPVLTFTGGKTREAGLLIGADGLHSLVRQALNGAVAPFFTHQIAWRATIPAPAGIRPVSRVFLGKGRHLVAYPLRDGRLLNLVAVEERRRWVEESWNLRDDSPDLRFAFDGFVPEVQDWLKAVDAPWLWGLFRHPVAKLWHGQGAAILGDAAHPTLPFLAQGANLALEDAWMLAESLATHDGDAAALAAYQAARAPRTARVVDAAGANARAFHLGGPARALAHLGLRLGNRLFPQAATARYRWLYDFDVTGGQGG